MPIATQTRQTLRRLLRSPLFTGTTLLTLALGVGSTTAIFSILYGVLFKALPHPDPDSLVGVWQTAPGLNIAELNASASTYLLYREEGKTFEDIAVWNGNAASVTGLAEPERVQALSVTDGFLPLLRTTPQLGRAFTRSDDSPGTPETVIVTHGYWKDKFGASPTAIGKILEINGRSHEIIGVMPESFQFMDRRFSLLLPMRIDRANVFVGGFNFRAFARLKPGITIAQANADVARMLPMLLDRFKMAPGISPRMFQEARFGPLVRPLMVELVGDIGRTLWLLMATVGIVLVIACANVANLLLVRVEGRQRELAVRAALGASWRRLARELLAESATLGAIGGVLGVGIAYGALKLLVALAPANVPRLSEVSIDLPVLGFAAAISLISGLLFGLVPVFKYSGVNVDQALRAGGRSASAGRERHRTRNILVVAQVALALVLLIGAGLMMRTLDAIQRVDPGFRNPDEVITLRLSIPQAAIADGKQVARTHQQIADQIAAIPGVTAVALASGVTMDSGGNDPIFPEGHPEFADKVPPLRRFKHIGPGYFSTMGNRFLAGRDFTWTDIHEMRRVIIVSENLAREYWGSAEGAIGKRIRESPKNPWREIVGVVAPEYDDGAHRPAASIAYWPILKSDFWGSAVDAERSLTYVIRSPRAGSAGLLTDMRQAVWSRNNGLPIANVRTLREIYDRSMARTSFTLIMLAIGAGMALLLGVIGIYGVISYSVAQRTREIGIRIALGAQQGAVRRLFVSQGLMLVGIGVVIGLAAAVPLSNLMSALLFGVQPLDLLTYFGVSMLLIAVAFGATYIPARRASAVEPMTSLRAD